MARFREKDRTDLLGAERDDRVDSLGIDRVDGLRGLARDVDPEFGEGLHGERVHARRARAGALDAHRVAEPSPGEPLGHLRLGYSARWGVPRRQEPSYERCVSAFSELV